MRFDALPVFFVCALALSSVATSQQAPDASSSSCGIDDCIISWTKEFGYEYQLQLLNGTEYIDIGSKGSFDFVEVSTLYDLWECRNVTARVVLFDGVTEYIGSPTDIPVSSSLPSPPQPSTPSLTVLGSDRIRVTVSTPDLSSTMHWIDMYTINLQRSDGGAVMKETTSLVFPIDATSKTLTHTFGGLDDNTRYNAWVTASSCAGDVDSSTDSAKTSLNIIIDDGSNDPLYLYWRLNITGVTLNTDAFSTDLFFAAVSTVLSENSLTISRTDMGVISFEVFEDVKLIMNTQLNVTVGTADAVGSVLESVSFPPCASELTRKLKVRVCMRVNLNYIGRYLWINGVGGYHSYACVLVVLCFCSLGLFFFTVPLCVCQFRVFFQRNPKQIAKWVFVVCVTSFTRSCIVVRVPSRLFFSLPCLVYACGVSFQVRKMTRRRRILLSGSFQQSSLVPPLEVRESCVNVCLSGCERTPLLILFSYTSCGFVVPSYQA
eukprot:m.155992 g.155992  ORF g.155992 m.155992 type:complete len:490 (+) comp13332_c0_seq12:160-1629(+)